MTYKVAFKIVSKNGSKIEMKLKNSLSAENAATLFHHSISILESNIDEDEDEDEEEIEFDDEDDSPDLSSFENKSLKLKFPDEDNLKLRIIHHNPDRIEELMDLMSDRLKMAPTQCFEMITNKEDIGPLPIEVADSLYQELHKMGVGVSVKKINDDKPLYDEEERPNDDDNDSDDESNEPEE